MKPSIKNCGKTAADGDLITVDSLQEVAKYLAYNLLTYLFTYLQNGFWFGFMNRMSLRRHCVTVIGVEMKDNDPGNQKAGELRGLT